MNKKQFISIIIIIVLGFGVTLLNIRSNGSRIHDQAVYDTSDRIVQGIVEWSTQPKSNLIFDLYGKRLVLNPNGTWKYGTTTQSNPIKLEK